MFPSISEKAIKMAQLLMKLRYFIHGDNDERNKHFIAGEFTKLGCPSLALRFQVACESQYGRITKLDAIASSLQDELDNEARNSIKNNKKTGDDFRGQTYTGNQFADKRIDD